MRTLTTCGVTVLLIGGLAPQGAAAGACTVPGTHSTIQAAINDPSCDPINVAPGTYAENLNVNRSVTIEGAGSALTTIDGSLSEQVVALEDGTARSLTLKGLTITRGYAEAAAGGGILVSGAPGHSLTLDDVVVTENISTDLGGGVAVFSSGSLQATNTTISMNQATGGPAGGLYLSSSSATLTRVLVDGNEARNEGAGITATDSLLIVHDSAIANNTGSSFGGILSTSDAVVSLANVTVSGNRVSGNGGGIGTTNSGDITGTNITVAANTADSDNELGGVGGGIFRLMPSGGPITLKNSIVAGNTDGSPPTATDCSGDITSNGHNILGSTTGCDWSAGPSDQLGVDPRLLPLADNGGGTPTHALKKGSPAIDQADASFSPQTDQRGLQRQDPDVGAYELVYCLKVPVNRIGTDGKDKLKGTNKADGMLGLGGKDTLNGKGGKDGLCGGGGKDTLKGGGGKDRMKGQGGRDRCVGGGGTDVAVCEEEKSI